MKVSFRDFSPNTLIKDRYEYIFDYISSDFDLDFEDAFYLIRQLKHNRSSVVIYGNSIADFHIFDKKLCVQIDGLGFWFAEDLELETAKAILRLTFDGCEHFGQFLPASNKEWDAYTL